MQKPFPRHELGIIYYITAGENLVYAGNAGKIRKNETYLYPSMSFRFRSISGRIYTHRAPV